MLLAILNLAAGLAAYVLVAGFVYRFVRVPEPDITKLEPWLWSTAQDEYIGAYFIAALWPIAVPAKAVWSTVRRIFYFAAGPR